MEAMVEGVSIVESGGMVGLLYFAIHKWGLDGLNREAAGIGSYKRMFTLFMDVHCGSRRVVACYIQNFRTHPVKGPYTEIVRMI